MWRLFWLILDIQLDLRDAGLRARVVGRRVPTVLEQFDPRKLVHGQTTPVGSCSSGLKAADARAPILIAKDSALTFPIPPEFVRAQQPSTIVIDSSDGPPIAHRYS